MPFSFPLASRKVWALVFLLLLIYRLKLLRISCHYRYFLTTPFHLCSVFLMLLLLAQIVFLYLSLVVWSTFHVLYSLLGLDVNEEFITNMISYNVFYASALGQVFFSGFSRIFLKNSQISYTPLKIHWHFQKCNTIPKLNNTLFIRILYFLNKVDAKSS